MCNTRYSVRQQLTHPFDFCVQWRTESICNRCPTVCTVKFWNKTENDSAKTIFLPFSRFNLITFFVIFSFCMLSLKYIFWERTGRIVFLYLPIYVEFSRNSYPWSLHYSPIRGVVLYCTCLYVDLWSFTVLPIYLEVLLFLTVSGVLLYFLY